VNVPGTRVSLHTDDVIFHAALTHWLGTRPGIFLVRQNEQVAVVISAADPKEWQCSVDVPKVLVADSLDNTDVAAGLSAFGVVVVLPRPKVSGDRLVSSVLIAATKAPVTGDALYRDFLQATTGDMAVGGLTAWEIDVLRLLAEGWDAARIASELGCSTRTVINVIYRLTTRLGLRNRSHAVAYAIRNGAIWP
jgi:DNA-binding NarL/FixJ family response regulator